MPISYGLGICRLGESDLLSAGPFLGSFITILGTNVGSHFFIEVLSISPSLPLLPEPMVKICPSESLQAPTSDAFLGRVALAPLPQPPRPQPPRPLFPPRPTRPAFVSRAMSSGILRFSFRGISRILFSCSFFLMSLAYSFANVLEEFVFHTHPYSNASVDRAGTLNPSSK